MFVYTDMQRNKTSPERISMLIYEPSKVQQRHLDKGDFEHTTTINWRFVSSFFEVNTARDITQNTLWIILILIWKFGQLILKISLK